MVPYLPDFYPDWDLQPIRVPTVIGQYVVILDADPTRAIVVIIPGTGGGGMLTWTPGQTSNDGIQIASGSFLPLKYKDIGPFVSMPLYYLDFAGKGSVDLLVGRTTPQWKVQQAAPEGGN